MLVVPQESLKRRIAEEKSAIEAHYNKELERILNENSHREIYWILGKLRFPEELGGRIGRTFLEACAEKPPLVREAFLYEVDNTKGVKTILWVMHPDGTLRLPTLNRTIKATPAKGRKIIT